MGSRRPFGSILGGFSKVLGRFWDGFGTDLGDFWNGFGLILERIWYMRGNWFWTWTWAWMQRFGLLCAFSLGKKHISVEPTLHFNQSLSMSGPPRCLAKLRGASQFFRNSLNRARIGAKLCQNAFRTILNVWSFYAENFFRRNLRIRIFVFR